MDRRILRDLLELRFLRDEELTRQLHRIDPHDAMGYLALIATLANILVSTTTPYLTLDVLLSMSFVFGILSTLNSNGILGKVALAIMVVHALAMHVLRTVWPL